MGDRSMELLSPTLSRQANRTQNTESLGYIELRRYCVKGGKCRGVDFWEWVRAAEQAGEGVWALGRGLRAKSSDSLTFP